MLVITLGIIGISYSAWSVIDKELVSLQQFAGMEQVS
jgi:hypothetical protein